MYINNPGHMTKMAAMPIYFKETWHEASMAQVLQCVYKSLPCDDLDLFYGKVNIGRQCI